MSYAWELECEQLAEAGQEERDIAEVIIADINSNMSWNARFPHLEGRLNEYEDLVWGMEIVSLRPAIDPFVDLPF